MDLKVFLIENEQQLEEIVPTLLKQQEIGVDLEFDRNSFAYGFKMCLIQISTTESVFLVDAIKIENLKSLWPVFGSKDVIKIMHSGSEDTLLLKNYGCHPKNLWDTEKAAVLINTEKVGLHNLVETFLEKHVDKGAQRTNWIKRPLDKKQLEYAAKDAAWLIPLKAKIQPLIEASGKAEWLKQEGENLENIEAKEDENPYLRIKGSNHLEPDGLKKLKAIYNTRESWAEEKDKPPYQIISNQDLVELASSKQMDQKWRATRSVHPSFKNDKALGQIKSAIKALANYDILSDIPKRDHRVSSKKKKRIEEDFAIIKEKVQNDYGINSSRLILSQSTIKSIINSDGMVDLKPYCRDIIFAVADDLGLDLTYLRN